MTKTIDILHHDTKEIIYTYTLKDEDVNLSDYFLKGKAIVEAVKNKIDLSGADLSNAYLARADLRGANMSRAYLYGADLRGADLSGGSLAYTHLIAVKFYGTELTGVDIKGTYIEGTWPAAWTTAGGIVLPTKSPTEAGTPTECEIETRVRTLEKLLLKLCDTLEDRGIFYSEKYVTSGKYTLEADEYFANEDKSIVRRGLCRWADTDLDTETLANILIDTFETLRERAK